ncbi:diaminobutyrate--2-oxoglutarate aminotransferase [Zafaria cholistanensis]|uniref:Diaminobutyrate--2-oxoglutarate transaminase n=2 Tax=Zafaria cholistanensis TaxID=1682741 RepID=A0A5A7NT14_9MICC|nr:diaminobutyrate--2-oxoglutarate aminotransferase [Zafaria cholistanensis]
MLARQQDRESNARTYPRHLPMAIDEAHGSFVRDMDGNVFIDCLAGAGVLSLGHNHPELIGIAAEQLGRFTHGLDFPTPAKEAFIEAQLSMLPAALQDRMKIHFCGPTGANAVDAAIKLCKTATGRSDVVSFQGGFHGSSAMGMALTGLVQQKAPVANGMPGVHFFPYTYCSRCPLGLARDTCSSNCVAYLENTLRDDLSGMTRPAAVILEMVQGEGGVIPATLEFVQRLRAITRELAIPLIVDEVQTGCGRTGTWFAFEQYGIEPDVIVASKALSGIGTPVAVIIYDRALDKWAPGAHTGTFRGNQLAFAAGAEAVRIVRRDGILEQVQQRGRQIESLLKPLEALPWVREVRGRGMMWGIEFQDPDTGKPGGDLAQQVQDEVLRKGLILETGGRGGCVVRLLPPLNTTEDVVEQFCRILVETVGALRGKQAA